MFNHKNGCQKCVTTGEYSKEYRTMSYPNLDSTRRTNESFRNQSQKSHHKQKSLFEELHDVNMINDFPTSDPLHLLELGVMRRCMYRWVFGHKSYRSKWSKSLIDLTSRLLTNYQQQIPSEIHRAVRGLDSLRHWKGTEYRTILLYVGIVVFKKVHTLSNSYYCNAN